MKESTEKHRFCNYGFVYYLLWDMPMVPPNWTIINFDEVGYDPYNLFDPVTHVFTVRKQGLYYILLRATIMLAAVGADFDIHITDAAGVNALAHNYAEYRGNGHVPTNPHTLECSTIRDLDVGDTIAGYLYISAGGASWIASENNNTSIHCIRLRSHE